METARATIESAIGNFIGSSDATWVTSGQKVPRCTIGVKVFGQEQAQRLRFSGFLGIVPRTFMAKIAIIQTGGKQYVVAENDIIEIERVEGAENAGDKVT
jgi:hypothetical protein